MAATALHRSIVCYHLSSDFASSYRCISLIMASCSFCNGAPRFPIIAEAKEIVVSVAIVSSAGALLTCFKFKTSRLVKFVSSL